MTLSALAGTFVLDLSRVLAGPTATQILGDLGADVVKVERPGSGDDTRRWGPPFMSSADGQQREATYFLGTNRNKRSIAIDIARPEGAALIRALAMQADVMVENFKTGGLERYGLDHATLAAAHPRLVYCSVTGFGQTGPMAAQPGYDFVVQAMGGLMSITGAPDDAPGGQPMKAGVAVADLFTGVYASTAILAALIEAQRSGIGQHIDMALLDVQVSMLANQAWSYLATNVAPGRLGNAHPSLAPYELLPTATEQIVIAVGNDQQFRRLVELLRLPGLADDPRFSGNDGRIAHRAELVALLTGALTRGDAASWLAALEAAGVPSGLVSRIDEVFSHPQVAARELVVEQRRPDLPDPIRSVASPIRLSRTPVAYRLPPPALGSHTADILRERLGLSDGELADLSMEGVIG